MATPITITFLFSTVLVYLSCRKCTAARDGISSGTSIGAKNQETLVSPGKIFQMGFFTPKRNQNDGFRYFGIWYYMDPSTVVWVANRDSPIPGSSTPVLTVEHDGNLVVKNKDKTYFTTGLRTSSGSRTARLLDTGNAILADDHTGAWAWQSFRYPTDTFLPGMFLDKKTTLTSWKSQEDPGSGDFVFQQDQVFGYNNYTIFTGKNLHWKSGFGLESTNDSNKMFAPAVQLLSNSSATPYTRLLMKSSGEIQYHSWDSRSRKWVLNWSQPKDFCSIYNACGPNSSCNISKNVEKDSSCKCFPGFELANDANQSEQKCKQTTKICSGDDNTFLKMMIVKIDVTFETFLEATSEVECKEKCLGLDCCQAYSYNADKNEELRRAGAPGGRQGCWIWNAASQFVDVQVGDPGSTGHIIAFRYSNSTGLVSQTQSNGHSSKPRSSSSSTRRVLVVLGFVIPGALLLCFISFICYRRVYVRKRKGNEESNSIIEFAESVRQVQDLLDPLRTNENDSHAIGIPFFDFERISAATDGFSDANKLGEGGFGPVYKGMFPGGVKIAVKRLSIHSGQGLEEFKNEVTLIAKLQHRNLVRLLGYCMRGNEKMLIYEYMSHKSLDAFIFDRTQSILLDWPKRFDIVLGISRGLIYLHQDSRLRIIHRDLKPSNILLDEDLNPKISDFGLAKIVDSNQVESNTKRVIGTYGYMAPEYALEGLFSVKSDVYSFGVVMLEIISGKKKHHQSEQSWSLINYAWHLWKEEKPLELMEPVLSETCDHNEVLRCIVVGLLCVQEDPDDRPNMSNVFMMLTSDIASLPKPNQPAFIARRLISGSYSSSSDRQQTQSQTNVDLTISVVQGR